MVEKRIPSEFLGKVRVLPRLPQELQGIEDLAYNMWWAWNPYARALFRRIHPHTWIQCEGNPIRFISNIRQEDLDAAVNDKGVREMYDQVMAQYNDYMSAKNSYFSRSGADRKKVLIAYFSAEFGIHESLPIYSGGLGVLAGDHCKSASDLGLPFVAVGLLYREGYFIQRLDAQGQQVAEYTHYNWRDLPVRPATDALGNDVYVSVELPGRTLQARVWKVQVGRNPLYLMDTDIARNTAEDRKITSRLYGGGEELRIQQEILLGIGGVRALRLLGYEPTVFHMNEGHSVFLGLERLREYIHDEGLSFRDAQEVVRASTLFTTHTPVPAGNDAFPPSLMERYFRTFWESLGISRSKFMTLGLDTSTDGGRFSLTILALNLAAMANGVSELHGHVSRAMWQHVWADVPAEETPIRHITNGIHTRTWLSIDMQELLDKYFDNDWRERLTEKELWKQVDRIPDEELWQVIGKLREDMINFVHLRMTSQHTRFGESLDEVNRWATVLDKDTLTIGFARRFATYKRATLIFRDKERLARILNNPARPIQIVFSGKAHPADNPGQEFIKAIQRISREDAFRGKIVFLENYDMNVGRRLTSGVDVWLNNPRRPLEASGTSGMKVPINGGINCSILDGWWREAFAENPECGWALGEDKQPSYPDESRQDEADAESIYRALEFDIAPLYYDRDSAGIPRKWLAKVRESMKTCAPQFSTNRMVTDYYETFYKPGSNQFGLLTAKRFERAKKNAEWKEQMRASWPGIRIKAHLADSDIETRTIRVRDRLELVAEVDLGSIGVDDVQVEIYIQPLHEKLNGVGSRGGSIPMRPDGRNEAGFYVYRGSLIEGDSGEYGYTVRVVPRHPDLVHPNELGLVSWAHPS